MDKTIDRWTDPDGNGYAFKDTVARAQNRATIDKMNTETADRKSELDIERKRIDNLIKELPATAGEYQQSKLVLHSYDNTAVKCTTTSGNYTNVPAFTTDQGGPLSSLYTKKSNYQIAVNKSGLYLFELRIHVNSLIANKRVELAPFVNDTRNAALASSYNTAGNFTLTQVAALPLWLSANDTVDFRIAPIEAAEVSLQLGDVLVYAIDWEDKFKIPDYTGYAAETKDIRTGADGTVYGTAGEAVRKQIGNLTEELDNKLIKIQSKNLADPSAYNDGYKTTNITSTNSIYRHTNLIQCKKGDVIKCIKSANVSEYYIICYADSNGKYITNSYTSVGDNNIATFTVPDNDGIKYCWANFTLENIDKFMITINNDYPTEYESYFKYEYLNNIQEKPITGILLFSGDSICYGAGYSGGYPSIIKKRNPLATIVNYGISGTTVAKRNGRSDSILERLDSMQESANFVIMEGGVNDAWDNEIELGTFSKNGNVSENTNFDEATFSGALESLFKKAYEKYPSAHIMFVIVSVSDNYSTYEYLNRAKEICEKWRVTPIDIRESGLNLMIKECVSLYGADGTDGTHPSKLGYEKFFVPMIEAEIKKYL